MGIDIFDKLAHCLDLPPFRFSLRLAFGRRAGRCVFIFIELEYRSMFSSTSFAELAKRDKEDEEIGCVLTAIMSLPIPNIFDCRY